MKLKHKFFSLVAAIALILPGGAFASSASLYLSPNSSEIAVGESVTVGVYVSSTDVAMNAASGIVSFPKDKLQVTSVSSGGSIIDLFVTDPSYSNGAGTVRFEGITLNPGYTGSSGKLISISFLALAPGEALLSFDSGSVLANDGEGTSILSGLGTAQITIGGEEVSPSTDEEINDEGEGSLPRAPVVSSGTHPDANNWYSESTIEFDWNLPFGTTGVSFLIDQEEQTDPGFDSNGVFSSFIADGMEDGEWFFHIRLKNAQGWGDVTHFKFNIDTTAPLPFDIGQVANNNGPALILDAEDEGSGISHYLVNVDDAQEILWEDNGSHLFTSELLTVGRHTLAVTAVDFAGNIFASSRILEIDESGLAAVLNSAGEESGQGALSLLLFPALCQIIAFLCIFLFFLCLILLFLLLRKKEKEQKKKKRKK